jgi:hypothetical protein
LDGILGSLNIGSSVDEKRFSETVRELSARAEKEMMAEMIRKYYSGDRAVAIPQQWEWGGVRSVPIMAEERGVVGTFPGAGDYPGAFSEIRKYDVRCSKFMSGLDYHLAVDVVDHTGTGERVTFSERDMNDRAMEGGPKLERWVRSKFEDEKRGEAAARALVMKIKLGGGPVGCDIHWFVEKRNSAGKWVHVKNKELDLPERNYLFFAVLAGVRAHDWEKELCPPITLWAYDRDDGDSPIWPVPEGRRVYSRGLPSGLSKSVMKEFERMASDAHTCNWLTFRELVKYPHWQQTVLLHGERSPVHKYCGDFIKRVGPRLRELCDGDLDSVRAVFWFDN